MGISIFNQEDAHEYLSKFLSRMDSALQYTDSPTLISDLFEGEMSDQLRCPHCGIIRDKRTPFTNISLESSDHGTLLESLQSYSVPEIISDFCCERCNQRVNVEKTSRIVRLPCYFIIQLKLFEFDYEYMRRRKLKPSFCFPMNVDFNEHSDSQEPLIYSLKGTVVHVGSADSGHYYSYIRDDIQEGGEWNEFNDEIVSPQDVNYLRASFEEHVMDNSQYPATPYLLFYEKDNLNIKLKTVEELFPEEIVQEHTGKKTLMRLLGLKEWPSLLKVCYTAEPTNSAIVELFMQYACQVVPVLRSHSVQTICQDILGTISSSIHYEVITYYACQNHLPAAWFSSNHHSLYDQILMELVIDSITLFLKKSNEQHI